MSPSNTVVLGVTGSIAAYKAVELASKLTQEGMNVDVVLTDAAQEFVTPLTFRGVTQRQVVTDMFDPASEYSVEHVSLAERADLVVIAPATANTIAKMAVGIADNILLSTVLATKAPVVVAPAMNVNMYENPVTQDNIARLKKRGFIFVGPAYGRLASGIQGMGRFVETEEILGAIHQALGIGSNLSRRKIVVSAGGTREPIDPVRHIGNRSSGKMGYAIAEAARDRGAEVVLVTAPTAIKPPSGVEVVQVETTMEMLTAIAEAIEKADVLIMAAAPADYRPRNVSKKKIKKVKDTTTLELVRNPDILTELQGNFIRIGFSTESEDLIQNATEKLKRKNLDLIVANDITSPDSGFDADTNKAALIDRVGNVIDLPLMPKSELAHKILDKVVAMLPERRKSRK
jgi:phosphopantothenoylcysteine decarboxylase/phosphopantothenate--cysteine ligase